MSMNPRADSAAERLKTMMGLPQSKVRDANYSNQEPPEGSYAARALQKQRQEAAQRAEEMQDLQRIPPNVTNPGEPGEVPSDAVTAPTGAPSAVEEPELSPRASERIAELARQRRDFEQRASIAESERQRLAQENEAMLSQLKRLQEEYHNVLQANLDHLDPEDRARVMAEANARQVADSVEKRILDKMQPIMDAIEQNNLQMELQRLAAKYPGFDLHAHATEIVAFKKANPSLSIEQAFRALASDEEIRTNASPQVPPVVAPRGTRGTSHIVEPPPKDPNLDLIEERNRWRELARSASPEDRKQADKMLQDHLKKRLFGGSSGD